VSRRFCWLLWIAGLAACGGTDQEVAPQTGCRAIAQARPSSVLIAVSQTVHVALTQDGGCPAPIATNETPAVIRLEFQSATELEIAGLAAGAGRIRVRSPIDTTVTSLVSITVTP